MSLGQRILGFVSAPFVGGRVEPVNDWNSRPYSAASDKYDENSLPSVVFGPAAPSPLVPIQRLQEPGDLLSNRAYGTHTLIPGRALSAQTRLKNMTYELPADVWTQNVEGPAYILRVPALPQQVINLGTINQFTTQPEYLQPITNLQIQNDMSLINQFRSLVFGKAYQQAQQQTQQNAQTMFPFVFGDGQTTPWDLMNNGG